MMQPQRSRLRALASSTLVLALVSGAVWSHAQTSSNSPGPLPPPMLEAVRTALQTHPSVQAQWHALQASLAQFDAQRAPWRPEIDLSASVGRESIRNRGDFSRQTAALQINQMLFDGGITRQNVHQAGFERLQQYYLWLESQERAALNAVLAYATLAQARAAVQLAQDNYVEHAVIHQLQTERAQAGVARRADVDQALGRLALAESNLNEELAAHQRAAQAYWHAMGQLPPAAGVALDASLRLSPDTDAADTFLAQGLRSSPRLWSEAESVRAHQAALDATRPHHAPRLDLRASHSAERNRDGVPGNARDTRLELLFSVNLYHGGAPQARSVRALENLNQSEQRLESTCRELRQTLTVALNEVRVQQQQTALLDAQRQAALQVQRAYRQQFEIGQRTLIDLLDAHNEAYEAERAHLLARHARFAAEARALAAAGGLTAALGLAHSSSPSAQELGQDREALDPSRLCAPVAIALVAVDRSIPAPQGLPRSYVVLLQNADGSTGRVVFAGDQGTVELRSASSAAALDGSIAQAFVLPEEQLTRDAGAAIAASPRLPQTFVLNFETGSTRLTPAARALLEQVFGAVNEHPAADVSVVGHTDTLGSAALNQRLSLRRAETVARLLQPLAARIVAIEVSGQGESNLLVATPDNVNEPRNRRVELTVR